MGSLEMMPKPKRATDTGSQRGKMSHLKTAGNKVKELNPEDQGYGSAYSPMNGKEENVSMGVREPLMESFCQQEEDLKETMERQVSPSLAPLRAPLTSLPMLGAMFQQAISCLTILPCPSMNALPTPRVSAPYDPSLLQEYPTVEMFTFSKFIRSALFNSR